MLKTVKINFSWFEQAKAIRCWFKSNSASRIFWAIKKQDNNIDATDADNDQSMFVLTILGKIKETRLKFSRRSVTIL